jgi:hypothetical protein
MDQQIATTVGSHMTQSHGREFSCSRSGHDRLTVCFWERYSGPNKHGGINTSGPGRVESDLSMKTKTHYCGGQCHRPKSP